MTDTPTTTSESAAESPPAVAPRTAYDVPDTLAAATCPECERPFPDEDLLALHRGLAHEASLSDADRETVARARDDENRRLRLFRLKALVVLVVMYFGLLMVYAVVT